MMMENHQLHFQIPGPDRDLSGVKRWHKKVTKSQKEPEVFRTDSGKYA